MDPHEPYLLLFSSACGPFLYGILADIFGIAICDLTFTLLPDNFAFFFGILWKKPTIWNVYLLA